MIQAKFSIDEGHLRVLEQCRAYGYKDKSALVRAALDMLAAELERKRLEESAELYAEAYEADDETREWTDDAVEGWP
ncbi:MAG: hypothetical protein RRA94_00155 [Bacteroidota bacterium]|nr:hypothetical protein [Bacteroidota bacterium]